MRDVIVLGSINMDIVASCKAHPRPGETVLGDRVQFFPGGKGANQAIAAARYLGRSLMIGSVGGDSFGDQMLDHLRSSDVDVQFVSVETDSSTGVALVTVDSNGENSIVVVPGANKFAKAPDRIPSFSRQNPPIALAQFEIPIDQIAPLFRMIVAAGGLTILNPSPFQLPSSELLSCTSALILNETEFSQLVGIAIAPEPEDVIAALASNPLAVLYCIVTLGSKGCVVAEKGQKPFHVPNFPVVAIDTTGAGDCFAGTFSACLAEGQSIRNSALRATAAAALSVTREGAGSSMPSRDQLESFLNGLSLAE
jgi:ribokinase